MVWIYCKSLLNISLDSLLLYVPPQDSFYSPIFSPLSHISHVAFDRSLSSLLSLPRKFFALYRWLSKPMWIHWTWTHWNPSTHNRRANASSVSPPSALLGDPPLYHRNQLSSQSKTLSTRRLYPRTMRYCSLEFNLSLAVSAGRATIWKLLPWDTSVLSALTIPLNGVSGATTRVSIWTWVVVERC